MEELSFLDEHVPKVYENIVLSEDQRDYLIMEHVRGFPFLFF